MKIVKPESRDRRTDLSIIPYGCCLASFYDLQYVAHLPLRANPGLSIRQQAAVDPVKDRPIVLLAEAIELP